MRWLTRLLRGDPREPTPCQPDWKRHLKDFAQSLEDQARSVAKEPPTSCYSPGYYHGMSAGLTFASHWLREELERLDRRHRHDGG